MKAILPVSVALVILGIGTYVQGVWSERWERRRTEKLVGFTARLEDVPKQIDDWVGEDQSYNEEEFKRSKCDGQVSRDYTNQRTGEVVSVYLVSGTGRHVTIHTPDWCYAGAGYAMEEDHAIGYTMPVEDVDPDPAFQTATFGKPDELTGTSARLRIFWAFSDDGHWQGPSDPKGAFGHRDAMYKLYFITTAAQHGESPEDSPALDFAEVFFPTVNDALFGQPETPADEAPAEGQAAE
jgi:hypothetical protein